MTCRTRKQDHAQLLLELPHGVAHDRPRDPELARHDENNMAGIDR